jgi:glycosyltransferase involved in cell wall biosynthesis
MALPSPLPVALFFSQFLPGGTEGQMIELARRLDRTRFHVHLACLNHKGSWATRAAGISTVSEFPVRGFRRPHTVARMWDFARWCRERRIAVLHATDLYANIFALPGAALARVPVRIGNRREINPDKPLGLIALQRASYAFAHGIVANSTAVAERLRAERVRTHAIRLVPNGIDVDAYRPRSGAAPLRRIVTVANLRPEKAHEVLIDAFASLPTTTLNLELAIVGHGPRAEALERQVAERGLASRVRFLGHRDDVPAILAESDLFVLPSRSEAFPNSVMEAMAAGLPVVATRVGGVPELVQHDVNGILTPVDDRDALARALRTLVDDPHRAAALGRAARETIASRFSFTRMVRSFEDLYLDLLHRGAARTAPSTQLTTS